MWSIDVLKWTWFCTIKVSHSVSLFSGASVWSLCWFDKLILMPKTSHQGHFYSWGVHLQHYVLITCGDSSAEMCHKTEPPVQCPVWLGWSSTALLCLLLIKQTIFILGGPPEINCFYWVTETNLILWSEEYIILRPGFLPRGIGCVKDDLEKREHKSTKLFFNYTRGGCYKDNFTVKKLVKTWTCEY